MGKPVEEDEFDKTVVEGINVYIFNGAKPEDTVTIDVSGVGVFRKLVVHGIEFNN